MSTGELEFNKELEKVTEYGDQCFGRMYHAKTLMQTALSPSLINITNNIYVYAKPPTPALDEKAQREANKENVFPVELEDQKNSVHGKLEYGQKVIAREVKDNPEVLEVLVFEKPPADDKPETVQAIKATKKGYVLNKYINPSTNENFIPLEGDIFTSDKPEDLIADVKQNTFGNCYLLASVLAILSRKPDGAQFIRQMMKQEGDSTVVKLYDPRIRKFVFIKVKNTQFCEDGVSVVKHRAPWVHILEKAYVALACQETIDVKGQAIYYSGDMSFPDMYSGGYACTAFTVLTGQEVKEQKIAPQANVLPWDTDSLEYSRKFGATVKPLLDAFVRDLNNTNQLKDLSEFENAIYSLRKQYPELLAQLSVCVMSSKNKAEIVSALDDLITKNNNQHLITIKTLLVTRLSDQSTPIAQQQDAVLLHALSNYLIPVQLPDEAANSSLEKLSLRLSWIGLLGIYLNDLKIKDKKQYQNLLDILQPKNNIPTTYEEVVTNIISKLHTVFTDRRETFPAHLKEILLALAQRVYFESSAKKLIPISVKDIPWTKENLEFCEKIHIDFQKIGTILNINELTTLEQTFKKSNLALLEKLLFTLISNGTYEDLENIIEQGNVYGKDTQLAVKLIFLNLTKLSKQEKGEARKALLAYIGQSISLKENSATSFPILKVTNSLTELMQVGEYIAQLKLENKFPRFLTDTQPENFLQAANDAYNHDKNDLLRVHAHETLQAVLIPFKAQKLKANKVFPLAVFNKIERYITNNFLPHPIPVDASKVSDLYSTQSLAMFYELKAYFAWTQNKYAIVACTKKAGVGVPSIPSFYAGHAYAIHGVVEEDGKKYVIMGNPWGCGGIENVGDHKEQIQPSQNGTFKMNLSDFVKVVDRYTIGTFTTKEKQALLLEEKEELIIPNENVKKKPPNFMQRNAKSIGEKVLLLGLGFAYAATIAGALAAPFTFGLSIPVCAAIGFGIGAMVGLIAGIVQGVIVDVKAKVKDQEIQQPLLPGRKRPTDSSEKSKRRPVGSPQMNVQSQPSEENERSFFLSCLCFIPRPRGASKADSISPPKDGYYRPPNPFSMRR